jgi:hypothetical protein
MAHRALLALAFAAAVAGVAAAPARAQQNPCEQQFMAIRTEVDNKGKKLQAAGARKAGPQEVCALVRSYADAEAQAVKFLRGQQATCQIPESVVKQAEGNHVKTVALRTKVCNAAASGAGAPPPASQGLSGALGSNVGGVPATTPGGSGVFDTMNGSVLRQ